VAHEAEIPVLVYRDSPRAAPDDALRVLYAANASPASQPIARFLHQLSWPEGAQGQLLHVLDYLEAERLREWVARDDSQASQAWSDAFIQQINDQQTQALERLTRLQAQLPAPFQDAPPLVVHGHIVEQIVKHVESESIDLVVVGARHLGPIARLLGSTTEGLLLRAPCAILLVHWQEEA